MIRRCCRRCSRRSKRANTTSPIASRVSPRAAAPTGCRAGSRNGLADRQRLARASSTGIELTDPMSGYFMLRTDQSAQPGRRLSGIGFKILLDILRHRRTAASSQGIPADTSPRAPRARASSTTSSRSNISIGLYDACSAGSSRRASRCSARSALLGVGVHMAVLTPLFKLLGVPFTLAQAIAAVVAMTFNFLLNNALTYRDQRLSGARGDVLRLDQVLPDLRGRRLRQCRGRGDAQ